MSFFIQAAHGIARKCGFDFRRYTKENFVAVRRAHLLQLHQIDTVVDIGAHTGTYGDELRQEGYRGGIVSFEPIAASFAELQRCSRGDSSWRCENSALGDFDGESTINVSGRSSSSSLLPIEPLHVDAMAGTRYVGTEKIRVARLDTIGRGLWGPEERLHLKIDVQGFERQVLAGAKETLSQVRCLELEMSLVRLYQTSPLYTEMIEWADSCGFDLVSIDDVFVHPQTGHVLQVNGIFVRRVADNGQRDITLQPDKRAGH